MNEKERQNAADMKEARAKLLECFPGSVRLAGTHGEIRPRRMATRIFNNRITKGENVR